MKLEKIVKISKDNLLNLLTEFRKNVSKTGAAFGSIVYFVDESKSKQVNGKKVLQKLKRTNITIGASYENRVNKLLTKEGEEANFTAQSMSGKEYVNEDRVIATDTKTRTKHYLVADIEKHNKKGQVTIYFYQNKPISFEKAKELGLFTKAIESEQSYGRGCVDAKDAPSIINPNVDSIISITLNKVKYIVEQ